MDVDTMTNVILQNKYKISEENNNGDKKPNKNENNNKKNDKKQKEKKNKKPKKTFKQKIKKLMKILVILIILGVIFLTLFFKTRLFQKYKELWVETAMSTMSHQWLATLFLSDEEIAEIMNNLEVSNTEDSDSSKIKITNKSDDIQIDKISRNNYVAYVMTIGNPSRASLVDSRQSSTGTKLSDIVKNNKAIAGINAGGFTDAEGHGKGNQLCRATIVDKVLQYGNKTSKYSLIGLSKDGKLILGNYTYSQAMNQGINSAVEFGPFLIVNGKKQITNSNSGGIQPRTAIGQKKDGTLIFVVVDGRQVGYSVGATLLQLQEIFEDYDAYNAANLDGGSSSTMYYDGKLVNKPSTPIGQRFLPNAFIVK